MSDPRAFANRRGYWLRQLSDCAERDFLEVAQTLTQYGGGSPALYAKCMDGLTWQGEIDGKTPLNSVDDVRRVALICNQQNIEFAPVVVPRGQSGEAQAHGELAVAVGSLLVDIELGPGFWDSAPPSGIPGYWAGVRAAAPDAWLVSQPDPRNLSAVLTSQSLDSIDAFAAQHYVGWSGVGWDDVVQEVHRFDAIASYGKPCYPTLYPEGVGSEVAVFWRAVRDYSAGFQCFRFGVMGPREFELARALKLPGEAL